MKDQANKFSGITIGFHWVIALAMMGMLGLGLYLEDMPRGPEKFALVGWHKTIGVMILLIAVPRVIWRLSNGMPHAASIMPKWQARSASIVHWFLLIGTVMMPVSGIMMTAGGGHPLDFFGVQLLAQGDKIPVLDQAGHILHGLGGKLILLAVILHIAGAVKHHVVDKDGTLRRMLGATIKLP